MEEEIICNRWEDLAGGAVTHDLGVTTSLTHPVPSTHSFTHHSPATHPYVISSFSFVGGNGDGDSGYGYGVKDGWDSPSAPTGFLIDRCFMVAD